MTRFGISPPLAKRFNFIFTTQLEDKSLPELMPAKHFERSN